MDSTLLNLLTRDGMLTVEFEPALDPGIEHYQQLYNATQQASATAAETRATIEQFAAKIGRQVRFQ